MGLRWLLLFAMLQIAGAGTAAPDLEALRGELDAVRAEAGVAGFGLVLVGAGEPQLVTGGVASWAGREAITADSFVRVGSISKTFTGLAFLAAAREGLLDLDAPIAPARAPHLFTNRWHPGAPVTLARLLEHTAGLRDLSRSEFDHNEPLPLADALAVAPSSRRLAWPPGRFSVYSNAGAGVAARVFELETGRDFERWLDESVFAPLAMRSATVHRTREVAAGLIAGYDRDGRTPIPYWHQLFRPFGAVNVRLAEMASLVEMLLAKGRLGTTSPFSPAEVARLESAHTPLAARAGLTFGYGFGNYAWTRAGHVWHGHGGDADGYLSHYGYSRSVGRGYFLVINAFQPETLRRMRRLLEAALAAELTPPPELPPRETALEPGRLVGTYVEAATRFGQPGGQATVRRDGDRLLLVRGRRREPLVPVGGSLFRREYEPVATIAFIEDGDTMHLQGPFGAYRREP